MLQCLPKTIKRKWQGSEWLLECDHRKSSKVGPQWVRAITSGFSGAVDLDLDLNAGRMRVGVKNRKWIPSQTCCLLSWCSQSSFSTVCLDSRLLMGESYCEIINYLRTRINLLYLYL